MRENRTPGSVRGASGNRRPYRDGILNMSTVMHSEIRCLVITPLGNPRVDENPARRLDKIYDNPRIIRIDNFCSKGDSIMRPNDF